MRGAGLTWILPGIQKRVTVDMRIATVDIPEQEVITKDNVPLIINAVVYYQIEDAQKATLNIQDYPTAVADFSQVALCDVVGGFELDNVLSEREAIADQIKVIVDKTTESWGINITAIKLQDIELPQDMKRIMAKQAESERERRSVINWQRQQKCSLIQMVDLQCVHYRQLRNQVTTLCGRYQQRFCKDSLIVRNKYE